MAIHRMMRLLLRILGMVWASPYTLLGVLIGTVGLCTGGGARVRGHTVEFYGGGVRWFLEHLPGGRYAIAITFGHTILGQTEAALNISRQHELVHVRQYQLWGPLFGPAYLFCSLVLWIRGRDTWRENPFEREALKQTGER
jgi:hypothetical protein